MKVFNRLLISLVLIAVLAGLGGALALVWQPDESFEVANDNLNFAFDLNFADGSEQALATVAIVALMAPIVALLAAELASRDRTKVVEAPRADVQAENARLQSRVDQLEREQSEAYPSESAEPRRRRFLGRA